MLLPQVLTPQPPSLKGYAMSIIIPLSSETDMLQITKGYTTTQQPGTKGVSALLHQTPVLKPAHAKAVLSIHSHTPLPHERRLMRRRHGTHGDGDEILPPEDEQRRRRAWRVQVCYILIGLPRTIAKGYSLKTNLSRQFQERRSLCLAPHSTRVDVAVVCDPAGVIDATLSNGFPRYVLYFMYRPCISSIIAVYCD